MTSAKATNRQGCAEPRKMAKKRFGRALKTYEAWCNVLLVVEWRVLVGRGCERMLVAFAIKRFSRRFAVEQWS